VAVWKDARALAAFARGLRGFYARPIGLAEARATVRRRLDEREANFLRVAESRIFAHPQSPYRPLFAAAGCSLGDLRALVRRHGLEPALAELHRAGVYVSFEEFKGRVPLVRGGRELPLRPSAFDNPLPENAFESSTGGGTGATSRLRLDLGYLAAQAPNHMLMRDAHGVLDVPSALWRPTLPFSGGTSQALRAARFGHPMHAWFTPGTGAHMRRLAKFRQLTRLIVLLGRVYGGVVPRPRRVPLDRAEQIAQWLREQLDGHGACVLQTTVSQSLRVCLAAVERGIDLHGAVCMDSGEPPSDAKVRGITDSGARYVPNYAFSEGGIVAAGCAKPADSTDVHLYADLFALVQQPREIPGAGATVGAFHFTSLTPAAPKVLLNVELDDYGLVEERDCGCPLGDLGYARHLRRIQSFQKLTGEGMTLVGSEVIGILESTLPRRFGGSPLDYQLLEEEDERGFTRLSIVVSPRVALADEAAVVETVAQAFEEGSAGAQASGAMWRAAGSLRVRRCEPFRSAVGKQLALHVAGRGRGS